MSKKHKKLVKDRKRKVGLPPGTLTSPENGKGRKAIISIFQYDKERLEEKEIVGLEDVELAENYNTWINIDGITDISVIEDAGQKFHIHPLILEDIASTDQRPKVDVYKDHLFLTLRMLDIKPDSTEIISEQISFVLGRNYVISFQEIEGDVFNSNRQRLRAGKGRSRSLGPDYLMYALVDTIVDHYYLILEKIGEKIEALEYQLITNPEKHHLELLYDLKNDVNFLRKSIWPLREVIHRIEREESTLISQDTRVFLKDVYDHTIQVMDTIDSYKELLSSMMDLYLSSVNNRMNEIMKVLTMIATIFIPLTFIAGWYGMNFDHMPELKWKASYPALFIVMVVIVVIQIFYFKRKKWL